MLSAEIELARIIAELERRTKHGGVYTRFFNTPTTRQDYPKHWQFFDAGANSRQRLFRAANRVGKTTAAGAELTYHLTGNYPDNWAGRRFDGASSWWVCGKSSETVKQILQPLLLGQVGEFGTGLIPFDALDHASIVNAKKASTGVGTFRVKHRSGGWSIVEFKSYDQGRQAFEGTARSIWCDEEPPEDVYAECLLRTMTGNNIFMLTFTPLKGASAVVMNFAREGRFEEGDIGNGRHVTTCTWDDVPHLDEQAKKDLLASIPKYQREARSKGVPVLGAGAIYRVPEDNIKIDPFPIPKHWKKAYGLDVGWNRTAAIWGAIDPDSSVLYLYSEHYEGEAHPSVHASAIRARGDWIPGVIDPAARGRTQDDGTRLIELYQENGLDLEKANNAVEAALFEIEEALEQGRIKVFSTLTNFFAEYRSYIRDEKGKTVKKNDHCFAGDTLVWTEHGKVPIKKLVGTEGLVWSVDGLERYTNCRLIAQDQEVVDVVFSDGTVRCTPDHLFLTPTGWVQAQDLSGCVVINTPASIVEEQWTLKSSAPQNNASMVTTTTLTGNITPTSGRTASDYINAFGQKLMAPFQRAITFIISMATVPTTTSATSNVSHLKSTMALNTATPFHSPKKRLPQQQLGTEVQKAANGTDSTRATSTKISRSKHLPVSNVASRSLLTEAQVGAAAKCAENAGTRVCQAVLPVAYREDVFCLDVPSNHAFAVGPGVIAHNCMDAFRYLWNSGRGRAKQEQLVNNQLSGLPTVGRRI